MSDETATISALPYSHEVYRDKITDPDEIAAIALAGAHAQAFTPIGEPVVTVAVVRYIVTWPDRE